MEKSQKPSIETLDLFMCHLYTKTELPLKSADLLKKYTEAYFKINHTIPNTDNDELYNIVKEINYDELTTKFTELRQKFLQTLSQKPRSL